MKIGLSRPSGDPGYPIPDIDMAEICQIAEACDFDWVAYGHHTIRPLDEPVKPPHYGVPLYQDPLIGAARALALTSRIEIAIGILVMPMLHPVNVAKQVATLDRYSGGGRFLLGLGTGGASPLEITASGGSMERRWAYTMESIKVMKGLWTEDRFAFNGEFFDIPPSLLSPKPLTSPHPPIWLGGFTDTILRRIAEECSGWLPAYAGMQLLPFMDQSITAPEHLRAGKKKIQAFAEEAGRGDATFEANAIVLPGAPPDCARYFEDAGADRLAFSMPIISTLEEGRIFIETLAEKLARNR